MKFCKDCKHLWGGDMCSSPKTWGKPSYRCLEKVDCGRAPKHGVQVWPGRPLV